MNEFRDEEKLHHFMGIEMNIQTWNLLGKENRDEQDNAHMINFAKISLYHWRKSSRFERINEQRGQWLISRVFAVLSKGNEALSYAQETLRLTEEHGFKDFDLAYAYESMARAHAVSGNKEKYKEFWKKARELVILLQEKKIRNILTKILRLNPGLGIRDTADPLIDSYLFHLQLKSIRGKISSCFPKG